VAGSKSKNKGKRGERELTTLMSELFGGSWVRVPNSGAAVGGSNAFRRQTLSETQVRSAKGDIIPPDHMPKIVLECKSYDNLRFHQLIQPDGCKQLDEWIYQTLDAVDENDVWFLTFKIDRLGWFICFSNHSDFIVENHCIYKNYIVTDMMSFLTANKDVILRLCSA